MFYIHLYKKNVYTECIYDTTWRDGTTIGGLATRDEMCQSTFWYYPRSQLRECRSEYQMPQLLAKFGIEQIANRLVHHTSVCKGKAAIVDIQHEPLCRSYPYEDVNVIAPAQFAGLRYTEVLDNRVVWTPQLREEVQTDSSFGLHDGVCYIIGGSDNVPLPTGYPTFPEEYQPINECLEK